MSNGSILVYYRGTDDIEFVNYGYLYSIGNIFLDENKNALISTSEDRSIRMVELPSFYPGQKIRRELINLNNFSIKNKIENLKKKDYYSDNINNNNNNDNDYNDNENDINENYKNINNKINYNNNNYQNNKNKNEDKSINSYQIMISEQ